MSHSGNSETEIKSFSGNQTPIAVAAVVLVSVIIVLILVLGNSISGSAGISGKSKDNASVADDDASVSSNTADYEEDGTIIIQGDRAMEIFTVSKKWLTQYGKDINTFAKNVPEANVYVLLAPTSVEFYGPDDYKTSNHSINTAMKYAYSQLTEENITAVNAKPALAEHTDEYIYFRTDHHWTATGAYYAYTAFCEAAGLKATKLEDHESGSIDGFVGSLYRETEAQVLEDNPDTVTYYYPVTESKGWRYESGDITQEGVSCSVINTNVSSKYAYLCFIEGDNPLEKFTTENKNGKSIILVKESYGNSFAPFLIDNYETVYVVDPRKVDMDLASFVKEQNIDDVLFLNYAFAPSNPTYRESFEQMLGID